MIHVIATIQLNPGKREAFLTEFHKLIPLVRAEDGCLEYGSAVDEATDIGAQEPLREDVVIVVEKWESVSHLKAHLVAPHMEAYRPAVKDLVVKTTLQILKPA